jgi:hypothetical protein
MKTNVSTLLREFPKVRQAALRGETVIVKTREGDLRITADRTAGAGLLGCLSGRMRLRGNLSKPTTETKEWDSKL